MITRQTVKRVPEDLLMHPMSGRLEPFDYLFVVHNKQYNEYDAKDTGQVSH